MFVHFKHVRFDTLKKIELLWNLIVQTHRKTRRYRYFILSIDDRWVTNDESNSIPMFKFLCPSTLLLYNKNFSLYNKSLEPV